MIGSRILSLGIFALGNQLLDQVERLGMVAIVDPGHLMLPSPVTRGEMIDLQMPFRITSSLVVDDPAGLFVRSHSSWNPGEWLLGMGRGRPTVFFKPEGIGILGRLASRQCQGPDHGIGFRCKKLHSIKFQKASSHHEPSTLVTVEKGVVLDDPQSIGRSQLRHRR